MVAFFQVEHNESGGSCFVPPLCKCHDIPIVARRSMYLILDDFSCRAKMQL